MLKNYANPSSHAEQKKSQWASLIIWLPKASAWQSAQLHPTTVPCSPATPTRPVFLRIFDRSITRRTNCSQPGLEEAFNYQGS